MIKGVDGTGPYNTTLFNFENRVSHVRTAVLGSKETQQEYLRGPGLDGLDMELLANQVVAWVKIFRQKQPKDRIILVGHSRGGAAVIRAAQIIQQQGPSAFAPKGGAPHVVGRVLIDAMFLFDAVNMTPSCSLDRLPSNIVKCYHAMRSPSAGSRATWGNCGIDTSIPNQMVKQTFFGSHAAMGGTPLTGDLPAFTTKTKMLGQNDTDDPSEIGQVVHVEQSTHWKTIDPACAKAVKSWMWTHLKHHNVV